MDLRSLHDAAIPSEWVADDASAELIARKGNRHELVYQQSLYASGQQVFDIAEAGASVDEKVAPTLAATAGGAEVDYQATLRNGQLFDHADYFLGQNLLDASLAAVQEINPTHLYVRGPPGSGKTYTGSRMVAALLAAALRAVTRGMDPQPRHIAAKRRDRGR